MSTGSIVSTGSLPSPAEVPAVPFKLTLAKLLIVSPPAPPSTMSRPVPVVMMSMPPNSPPVGTIEVISA